MTYKTIIQTVVLPGSPGAVFRALMDEKRHRAFTGAPARIEPAVASKFRCYGGYITGITLELQTNRRIVQAWRGRDWALGHYSLVRFELASCGKTKTTLHFTQVGVPAGDYKSKCNGWRKHYWEPLKRYLADQAKG